LGGVKGVQEEHVLGVHDKRYTNTAEKIARRRSKMGEPALNRGDPKSIPEE